MIMTVAFVDRPEAETEWVQRCRDGDPGAWRTLYDRHLPTVYRLAVRMGAAPRDARDICQDVFLRVYRNLASFRGQAQFATWLYRITLNEVARARRQAALRNALSQLVGREPQ